MYKYKWSDEWGGSITEGELYMLSAPPRKDRRRRMREETADCVIAFNSFDIDKNKRIPACVLKNRYSESGDILHPDFLIETLIKAIVQLRETPTLIPFFEDSIAIEIEEVITNILNKYDRRNLDGN